MDDTIRAARQVGLRFHPVRGGMSAGVSKGGIAPDDVVEEEEHILADMERCIHEFHDNSKWVSACGVVCEVRGAGYMRV